jgi:hypothetical protein
MNRKPLYIETKIRCDMETLWKTTQDPGSHEKWDLRFSSIHYLPKKKTNDPQKFLYTTRIGFGLQVSGLGESVATRAKDGGERTSVLKFWSREPLSIIRKGAGFWKYVPEKDGIKFYTGYDYDTRWGFLGSLFDRFVFRPLMVWATAWSFDRLKNWLEKGIAPRQALLSFLTVAGISLGLGVVWIYQGLVPKLLFADSGEIGILKQLGLCPGHERDLLAAIGIGEILFGLLMFLRQRRWVHVLNLLSLVVLGAGALKSSPLLYTLPFNPFALNFSMMVLSGAALLHFENLPRPDRCVTRSPR